MKKLQAKIGTHSLCQIYVRGNLKIEKNKKIKFKVNEPFENLRNTPWQNGWIDNINDIGIVFISRL